MTVRASLLAALMFAMTFGALVPASISSLVASNEQTNELYLPAITQNYCGSFFDAFDDSNTGWITGQYGDLQAQIDDGEYILKFTGAGMVWLVPGPVCQHSAYQAAVDVRWIGDSGNFAGLLFNLDGNAPNGYLFAINTDDRVWLVFEVVGGSLQTVIAPVGNDAILPGNAINRLTVERASQTIVLIVNGIPVGELRDNQSGQPVIAGVAAASYTTQQRAEIRFDNFHYEPISPANN